MGQQTTRFWAALSDQSSRHSGTLKVRAVNGGCVPMKLLQASSAALVGMALCSALYAYQRTADFGFGDDAETNVKAEFYWSRLSYTQQ